MNVYHIKHIYIYEKLLHVRQRQHLQKQLNAMETIRTTCFNMCRQQQNSTNFNQ